MTIHRLRAALFVWAILIAAQAILAAERKPPPNFAGAALPEPPAQHKAWTAPPTALLATMLSAVDLLYQQGMADPRGCEYREIEVVVGSVWGGDGGTLKVHGWVLPAEAANAPRFAVCWNGLVYPAISLGGPAGLKADFDALAAQDRKAQDEWAKHRGESGLPFVRRYGVIPEFSAISETEMCPTKICPLLRLGEGKLAEAYWMQLAGPAQAAPAAPKSEDQKERENDPYLSLAHEWAWMAFDRAVCAHMRGDNVVSFDTATLLARARRKSRLPPRSGISSVRWPSTRRTGIARSPMPPISDSSGKSRGS